MFLKLIKKFYNMDHSKQQQKEKLSYDGIKDLFSHG